MSVSTPILVGVLNVTPDSFSDGGRLRRRGRGRGRGRRAWPTTGAGWIDVGGESTRPGAAVGPRGRGDRRGWCRSSRALRARLAGRARISIDTYKAGTARAALAAGATVVNDVSGGLLDPDILRWPPRRPGGDRARPPARRAGDDDGRRRASATWSREVGDELQARIAGGAGGRLCGDVGRSGHRLRQAAPREPGAAGRPARAVRALGRAGHGRGVAQAVPRAS